MTTSEMTLDRRRVETWNAIHHAAAERALEDGLTQATIDAIANQAGVSRRTFFNYFPTKEDAILGIRHPEMPDDALAEFQADESDLLASLVHFMIAVLRTSYRHSPNPTLRFQLIERFPELRLRQFHYAGVVESMIAPILLKKLSGASHTAPGHDEATADAMLMLARTIMKFAYSRKSQPSSVTREDISESIEMFRKITKENR